MSQAVEAASQSNTNAVFLTLSKSMEVIKADTNRRVFDCNLPVAEAVYVEKIGGQEQLVYRTSEMEMDKLYPVEWDGEKYALRKTKQSVEIFKFYPEEK